jgi:hypothetical protein
MNYRYQAIYNDSATGEDIAQAKNGVALAELNSKVNTVLQNVESGQYALKQILISPVAAVAAPAAAIKK